MTAKISSMHLDLPLRLIVTGQRELDSPASVNVLPFLVISLFFFFLAKVVCSLSLRRHVI